MKKLLSLFLCILLLGGCAATYDGPTKGEYVLTEETETDYAFGRVQSTSRIAYAYDIYGNLVREMKYREDDLRTSIHYRYDDRGNLISQRYWDHTKLIPLPQSSSKNTYDEKDRLLTTVHYDGWGRETYRVDYTYDDEANSYTCIGSDGTPSTYYLSDSGKTLRLVMESSQGLSYEYRYEYDDRDNHIGTTIYKEGTLYPSFERRFDNRDRTIWEGDYDAAGNLERETSYEYDDETRICTIHHSWGTDYSYYDTEDRIHMTEEYDLDGTLSTVIQYTYHQIQVPAEGDDTP